MSETLAQQRLAVIGGGVMGEAIIRGLVSRGVMAPRQITVGEPVEARRRYLEETLRVHAVPSNASAVEGASIVLFAVKPQVLEKALEEVKGLIPPSALVISIVAGVRVQRYLQALGVPAVVRVMPNTPAQIGQGVSMWTATPETSAAQRLWAQGILGALGVEIYTAKEDDLDMATALSGSGPAYVFLFIEALTDAGVQMGLGRDVAATLALQTVLGSALYLRETGEHPAILRNRVTSPGGTTAAALYALEEGGLRATVARAVLAAYTKARELGDVS